MCQDSPMNRMDLMNVRECCRRRHEAPHGDGPSVSVAGRMWKAGELTKRIALSDTAVATADPLPYTSSCYSIYSKDAPLDLCVVTSIMSR